MGKIIKTKLTENLIPTYHSWAEGSQDKEWMKANGEEINNNQFEVSEVGDYSVYYVLENYYEFVETFTVLENELSKVHTPPTITVIDNHVTVSFNSELAQSVTSKKYALGIHDTSYFTNNGISVNNNTFDMVENGYYTYYYEYRGMGFVSNFVVQYEKSALEPIDIWGVAQRVLLVWEEDKPTYLRWADSSKDIEYFRGNKGLLVEKDKTVVLPKNESFVDIAAGTKLITIYMRNNQGEDAVIEFDTTAIHVMPVTPKLTWTNRGMCSLEGVENRELIDWYKWDSGNYEIAWFTTQGNGVAFDGNSFEVSKSGLATVCISYKNYKTYKYLYNITDITKPVDIGELKTGTPITFGGRNLLVVGDRYVMERTGLKGVMDSGGNSPVNKFADASRYTNIAYYLNGTFCAALGGDVVEALETVTWNLDKDKSGLHTTDALIGLLTRHLVQDVAITSTLVSSVKAYMTPTGQSWSFTADATSDRGGYFTVSNADSFVPATLTGEKNVFPVYRLKAGTMIEISV